MVEHLRTKHKEYASPGNSSNLCRLPMPADMWHDVVNILPKEYVCCGIDTSFIPTPFDHISTSSHSPSVPSTPSGGKRSRAFTNTMIDVPASKQPRVTIMANATIVPLRHFRSLPVPPRIIVPDATPRHSRLPSYLSSYSLLLTQLRSRALFILVA